MFVILPIAFMAGVLTAFTPCALPILPIILASGLEKRKRTLGIISGLIVFFVITTLFLSSIVQFSKIGPDTIRLISMVMLVLVGLLLIFPEVWQKFQFEIEKHWHVPVLGKERTDFIGGFLTGSTLGIVWTPCVGPVVAAITALTASSGFSISALLIALSYGLGIGLSLWFIAIGTGKATSKLGIIKRNNEKIRKIFGIIIIVTAVFILFGIDKKLQTWTLNNLPSEWTQAGSLLQDSELVVNELDEL